jgi:hypothetical protein
MARASVKQAEEAELIPEPVTEMITYLPGPLDPVQVTWGGHVFHANVPKEIRGHAAGSDREKFNLGLIESARANKTFAVGNAKPKRDAIKDPTTAEEYRAYFVEWLKDPRIEHAEPLIERFANDRELQLACGVGTDDFEYMGTLFMPRLYQLAKADELTEQQLAAVWVRHGVNQLPW